MVELWSSKSRVEVAAATKRLLRYYEGVRLQALAKYAHYYEMPAERTGRGRGRRRGCGRSGLLPRVGALIVEAQILPGAPRLSRGKFGIDTQRTIDQLRVDALVRLCADSLDKSHQGKYVVREHRSVSEAALSRLAAVIRRRTVISVHVNADMLTGDSDEPVYLAGHGWLPAPVARRRLLGANAVIRRIIDDPVTGAPLDASRKTYRPDEGMAEVVRQRDRTCKPMAAGRWPAWNTGGDGPARSARSTCPSARPIRPRQLKELEIAERVMAEHAAEAAADAKATADAKDRLATATTANDPPPTEQAR